MPPGPFVSKGVAARYHYFLLVETNKWLERYTLVQESEMGFAFPQQKQTSDSGTLSTTCIVNKQTLCLKFPPVTASVGLGVNIVALFMLTILSC